MKKGGLDEKDKIGGSLDYELHLDFQKMGLWPGAFVRLYGETQYGSFANSHTGAALGVNCANPDNNHELK